MIVEFQLSLERQAVRWYAQQDINTFGTFPELVDKFLEMFEVKIDPTEVLKIDPMEVLRWYNPSIVTGSFMCSWMHQT
jgi:hypothetical protein